MRDLVGPDPVVDAGRPVAVVDRSMSVLGVVTPDAVLERMSAT